MEHGIQLSSLPFDYAIYCLTHEKKLTNGDLFSQDRGHYIFSCSLAIFFKIYFEKSIFSHRILINGHDTCLYDLGMMTKLRKSGALFKFKT